MSNKTIYWIIGIIVLLLLVNQGRKFGLEDDYMNYDDFTVEEDIFNRIDTFIDPCDAQHILPEFYCANWWVSVQHSFIDTYGDIVCIEDISYSGRNDNDIRTKKCTNDKWKLYNQKNVGVMTSYRDSNAYGNFYIDMINKNLVIEPTGWGDWSIKPSITPIMNFKGKDVKLSYTIYSTAGSDIDFGGGSSIYINEQLAFSQSRTFQQKTPTQEEKFLFEIQSSRINPNNINIYINGNLIKEMTIEQSELLIKLEISKGSREGNIKAVINSFKYRIPFSCVQQTGDLLAIETFAGGQAIDINDLRFPVKSFCLAHPVIITSPDGSTTSAEPYQVLITGQPVTIPADQTWSFFYVFDNSGQIVRTCPSGNAYDPANDYCRDVHGLVQVCSEGVFDPAYGTCVIYPEVKGICDKGRWDTEKQACVWNPPIIDICETGTWSAIEQACVWVPDITGKCNPGIWNEAKGLCIYKLPIIIDQPTPDEGIIIEPEEPTSPIVYILIGGIIFMAFIALRQKGYLKFKR